MRKDAPNGGLALPAFQVCELGCCLSLRRSFSLVFCAALRMHHPVPPLPPSLPPPLFFCVPASPCVDRSQLAMRTGTSQSEATSLRPRLTIDHKKPSPLNTLQSGMCFFISFLPLSFFKQTLNSRPGFLRMERR